MKFRRRTSLAGPLAMILMLTACGGEAVDTSTTAVGQSAPTQPAIGEDPTTTAGGEVTTTSKAIATTTTEDVSEVGVDDIQSQCLAAISSVLQTFEPVVREVDWQNATIEDHLRGCLT